MRRQTCPIRTSCSWRSPRCLARPSERSAAGGEHGSQSEGPPRADDGPIGSPRRRCGWMRPFGIDATDVVGGFRRGETPRCRSPTNNPLWEAVWGYTRYSPSGSPLSSALRAAPSREGLRKASMQDPTAERGRGEVASAISTRTVQVMHEHTGRGPTKARTIIDRDFVTVVMEDSLTHAERNLVESGLAEKVLETRHDFQRLMSEELIALVEAETGRKVRAFMSDNHIDPDVAAEVFVLEPVPEGDETPGD